LCINKRGKVAESTIVVAKKTVILHKKMKNDKSSQKASSRPDGKPGRELALWAEGFFRLEFLLLLFQDKRSSPRGNERTEYFIKTGIFFLSDSEEPHTCIIIIQILRFSE